MTSSAGWNTRRTRPGSGRARCRSCSARPAPSSAVVCTSCPQACATPSTVERQGSGVSSSTGRASRSARRATTGADGDGVAHLGQQAAARQLLDGDPLLLQPRRHELGRAHLVPRRLGVGVDVAAGLDQLVAQGGDEVGERRRGRRRGVRFHDPARLAGVGGRRAGRALRRPRARRTLRRRRAARRCPTPPAARGRPRRRWPARRAPRASGRARCRCRGRRPAARRSARSTAGWSRSARSAASRAACSASIAGSTRSGS